jgi:hypothetical protein
VLFVIKYGSFNLLEASGLLQACNGIALLPLVLDFLLSHRIISTCGQKNQNL